MSSTLLAQEADLVLDPDGCPEGAPLTNGQCVGSPDPDTGDCPVGTSLSGDNECTGVPLEIVGDPTCAPDAGDPTAEGCDLVTDSNDPECGVCW